MPKDKNSNLVSQAEAGRLAGVSRAAIGKIIKYGTYSFHVTDGGKTKIDTSHQDWASYMHERGSGASSSDINKELAMTKIQSRGKPGKNKSGKSNGDENEESEKQKHALNGGFDIANYIPTNIADVKRLTEIQKLNIEMRVRLGELIERDLIMPVLDAIGQSIQSYFVDLPRKTSNKICKKLDRVGMEKEVEKVLSEPIAKGIREMKKISEKMSKAKKLN